MISRKEFKRQYLAELLPTSAANYAVGDIWDRIGMSDTLVPENENIGYLCGNEALSKQLETIERVDANFPDIDITQDVNEEIDVQLLSFDVSVLSSLHVQKVEKMVIKGVTVKNSLNGYKNNIAKAVEVLRNTDIEKYRKKLRSKELVLALFYAECVEIQIAKEVNNQNAFKLALEKLFKVDSKVKFETNNKVKISLSNPECPFAAQFVMGRDI